LIILENADLTSWPAGHGSAFENLVIRRIHTRRGSVFGKGNIVWLISAKNVLFSDCVFEAGGVKINCIDGHSSHNIAYHRCIAIDNYDPNTHNQGFFAQGVHGLLISQCHFDRNGWKDANYTIRTVFDHNMYIQHRSTACVVWGVWAMRGGNHGIQARGGGTIAYSVFSRNQSNTTSKRIGCTQHKNIYLNTEPACLGPELGQPIAQANINHSTIEFCLAAHDNGGTANTAMIASNSNDYTADLSRSRRYSVVRHSLVTDHNRAMMISGHRPKVKMINEKNILLVANDTGKEAIYVNVNAEPDIDWLESNRNVWYALTASQAFRAAVNGSASLMPLETWQATYAKDTDSIFQNPTLVDPGYNLADYAEYMGGDADEHWLLNTLRSREAGEWEPVHDTLTAWDAFPYAYSPLDVGEIDAGPFGFYGPSDYRSGGGVAYSLQGPASGFLGRTLSFSVLPSGTSSEQLDLGDEGAGGTFVPVTLAWNDDAATRAFTYSAARHGAVVIKLLRQGDTVASSFVLIKNSRLERRRRRLLEGTGSPL
jgi:hypothetical protein